MNSTPQFNLSPEKRTELLTQLVAGLIASDHYIDGETILDCAVSDANALLNQIEKFVQ